MDFADGGELHYAMTGPGAPDMWGKFVYARIVPRQRIEFVNSFSGESGNITRAPFAGLENWPLQVKRSFCRANGFTRQIHPKKAFARHVFDAIPRC